VSDWTRQCEINRSSSRQRNEPDPLADWALGGDCSALLSPSGHDFVFPGPSLFSTGRHLGFPCTGRRKQAQIWTSHVVAPSTQGPRRNTPSVSHRGEARGVGRLDVLCMVQRWVS
jgi:hypothetical protein